MAGAIALSERVFATNLVLPLNLWPPILAMVAALALAWRLWLGHARIAPLYAFVASYAAQAHVMFLAPIVLITAGLLIVSLVRNRGSDELQRVWTKPWQHTWVWTTVVTVVCWLPPTVDFLVQDRSNLGELFKLLTADNKGPTVGVGKAASPFAGMMIPLGRSDPAHLVAQVSVAQAMLALTVIVGIGWAIVVGRHRLMRGSGGGRAISVLAVVIALASASFVWTASHTVFVSQLLYLDLAIPVAVLLTLTALWWAVRFVLLRVPRAEAFASKRGASGIVVLVVALVATVFAAPGRLNTMRDATVSADNVVAKSVVQQANSFLNANHAGKTPLIIESYGATAYGTLGSAIAIDRVTDGQEVYFGTFWPLAQDDDFRRPTHAPFDAYTLIVREHVIGEPWSLPKLPAGVVARDAQPASLNGQPGQVELVLVKT